VTAERRILTAEQVEDIRNAMGVTEGDGRVWVLAVDLDKEPEGVADVLAADDVIWFTGADMVRSSWTNYRNGTLQMTFKHKDRA
jgi:hypothetical protein